MFGIDDAAIAAVAAGVVSTAGQLYSNSANRKFQNDTNDLSVKLANTAHQREIADLKAAGLNPILSASGSGASVPSLGVANNLNPAQGISEGINSAAKLMSDEYKAQIEAIKANTASTNVVTSAAQAELEAMRQQQQIDRDFRALEKNALDDLTGKKTHISKDGFMYYTFDEKKHKYALDLVKEGIISDLKNRANQNWRNNLNTLTGATTSALQTASKFIKKGK